ncbi:hypothetical protein B0H14DRAFT_3165881 [Mycena olivaceomarginata]|nr:hypothetical protein B0H14DRAFT_3165881 [Mycena olivaceomarginata]
MPEIAEQLTFRVHLRRFIQSIKSRYGNAALGVEALYTDVKESELADMELKETRLLRHASTLCPAMLGYRNHLVVWATRLHRIAESIPDTHGLMIRQVWARLPEIFKTQISRNYTCWYKFCGAICFLKAGVKVAPRNLSNPWFLEPNPGNLVYGALSQSQLVVRLNVYMSPTWRGIDPDRRYTANIPPLPDRAWEDPISIPSTQKIYPSPKCLHHEIYGDVFSPTAPPLLANPASTRVKKSRSKAAQAKEKDLRLWVSNVQTRGKKPAPEDCTDADVDHSLYLLPQYLFPSLENPVLGREDPISTLGLQLDNIEYDPRSMILDLKKCYLEIESLLHTSPQIFRNEEWKEVMRVPAKYRGFKVVIALQLRTHTIAWLSMDNLCYVYWFSRKDMEAARAGRVPDVLFDFWSWSEYVVRWLEEQDNKPRWDMHSFAEVLSMPGNHPMRGVGKYSLDEIAHRSGIPLWTLWKDVRLSPKLLCAVLETFFLFALERYLATDNFLAESVRLNKLCGQHTADNENSFLLITTKKTVLRYDRMVSVHRQLVSTTSARKKCLIKKYNRLSIRSHREKDLDGMKNAPWPFDLADLAPALLLFGHMGQAIASNWQEIYSREAHQAQAAIPATMKNMQHRLPEHLSPTQILMFKPVTELTPSELGTLTAKYGSATNPVVRYFQKKAIFSQSTLLHVQTSTSRLTSCLTSSTSRLKCSTASQIPRTLRSQGSAPRTAQLRLDGSVLPPGPSKGKGPKKTRAGPSKAKAKTKVAPPPPPPFFSPPESTETLLEQALLGDLPLLTDDEVEEDEDAEPEPVPEPDAAHVKPGFAIVLDPLFEREEDSDNDEEPLTLISDKSRGKTATRLCKGHAKNGSFCWTVLKPPYFTVAPNRSHKPTNALVFSQIMNRVRKKRTLRAIKATMKLYTVGPMDFCGHAKAVQRGGGWLISLCQWDRTLSTEDQLFVNATWEAIGTWRKGMRKDSKVMMAKEINFRTKVTIMLLLESSLNPFEDPQPTTEELDTEQRDHR